MKIKFLSMKAGLHLLFCCFSTCAIAQPVLTRDNCAPIVGTIYELEWLDASSLFPGPSGASVTWDFSSVGMEFPLSITFTYDEAASSPYAGLYPDANLVRYGGSSSSPDFYQDFYSATSTAYEELGRRSPAGNNSFSNTRLAMPFPFTFGDEFTDPHYATGNNEQGNYILHGTDTVKADGYGMLILPEGIVLEDVLRIKTKTNAERVQNGSTLIVEAVTYSWYKPGIRDAVLTSMQISYDGDLAPLSVTVQSVSSILRVIKNKIISTSVVPNPIQSSGKIMVGGKGKKTACFFDVSGKKFLEPVEFTANELRLNRNDFKPGIYFYTIVDETGAVAKGKIVFI